MTINKSKPRPKKSGSIYERSDGKWYAAVELPPHNGKRRRKVVSTPATLANGKPKTEEKIRAELDAKIFKIRVQLNKDGDVATAPTTVAKWMDTWFTTIALKKIRPRTAAGYRSMINNYIVPSIGKVRVDKLGEHHVVQMRDYIIDTLGKSSTTALQTHRVLTVALKYAMKAKLTNVNVAATADAPRKARTEPKILTAGDGIKVLRTVAGSALEGIPPERLASRWAAALLTGARQGELLGLELDRIIPYIDEDGEEGRLLDLSWQLQRISWEHGCGKAGKDGARLCGRKRGTDCVDRKVTMPADWEHRRLEGGLLMSRPKSSAGWRIIPLVEPLSSIIDERLRAIKDEPNPHGLLWTTDAKETRQRKPLPLDGSPLDPSRDNAAWHRLLERAGVPDVRLHDARHTTASLLLAARVPEPIIMKILGHSSYVVTRGYQNVSVGQLAKAMSAASSLLSYAPPVTERREAIGELPDVA
jgi:integrase